MGLGHDLYEGRTAFRFLARRRRAYVLSLALVLVSVASFGLRGLDLGIDFEGGVVWEVPAGGVGVAEARDDLTDLGLSGATIQTLTAGGDQRLRVEAEVDAERDDDEVSARLATLTGSERADVSFNQVGPSWGQEITESAARALVVFLVLLTLYITLRFEWRMAVAILVGLFHDIVVTVGVYSVLGLEVTPATVVAFLTILGYSVYDGIVVFDKVDENTRLVSSNAAGTRAPMTYGDIVDLSLNQTLMRSLNTSITATIPVASLLVIGSWVLGATPLEEFSVALLVGLVVGVYSSIFIAAPVLVALKEREPRYQEVRRRVEVRTGERSARATDTSATESPVKASRLASATADAPADEAPAPRAPTGEVRRPTGAIPPRPRKKGRRR